MADLLALPRGAVVTALVTPMTASGRCDAATLDALVDRQLAAGIPALVALGSTGEAAAFRPRQRQDIVRRIAGRLGGRALLLVGTGEQATWSTIEAQRRAADAGADAALLVSPPYCRPEPEGLRRHVEAVAAAAALPLVLYNVPARSGCDWTPEALALLSEHPQVVGVKEATGRLERVGRLRALCPRWRLWSGDDPTAADFVRLGGDGVVSVASNLAPGPMIALLAAAAARSDAAAPSARALAPLLTALQEGGNPPAIKALMAELGLLKEHLAAPLLPLRGDARRRALADAGSLAALASLRRPQR